MQSRCVPLCSSADTRAAAHTPHHAKASNPRPRYPHLVSRRRRLHPSFELQRAHFVAEPTTTRWIHQSLFRSFTSPRQSAFFRLCPPRLDIAVHASSLEVYAWSSIAPANPARSACRYARNDQSGLQRAQAMGRSANRSSRGVKSIALLGPEISGLASLSFMYVDLRLDCNRTDQATTCIADASATYRISHERTTA